MTATVIYTNGTNNNHQELTDLTISSLDPIYFQVSLKDVAFQIDTLELEVTNCTVYT